jgi:GTP-dependent dephospho-CoA kinase
LAAHYRLPEEMRGELAKPMGRLFKPAEISGPAFKDAIARGLFVITVGDRVTETAGKLGRAPDVQIVDSLENRKPRTPPDVAFVSGFEVANPPGGIAAAAVESIRKAMVAKKPARVLVDGEEDLLAIPAMILAPEDSRLFYGQPGEGIVMVTTDAAAKQRGRTLMKRMGFAGTL